MLRVLERGGGPVRSRTESPVPSHFAKCRIVGSASPPGGRCYRTARDITSGCIAPARPGGRPGRAPPPSLLIPELRERRVQTDCLTRLGVQSSRHLSSPVGQNPSPDRPRNPSRRCQRKLFHKRITSRGSEPNDGACEVIRPRACIPAPPRPPRSRRPPLPTQPWPNTPCRGQLVKKLREKGAELSA